ncbi:hypothetical protein J6590_003487 [Homalodisca vitripennis]|nr:hypothetical protein J6590_003487 [Homalodisca vitripennis]
MPLEIAQLSRPDYDIRQEERHPEFRRNTGFGTEQLQKLSPSHIYLGRNPGRPFFYITKFPFYSAPTFESSSILAAIVDPRPPTASLQLCDNSRSLYSRDATLRVRQLLPRRVFTGRQEGNVYRTLLVNRLGMPLFTGCESPYFPVKAGF